MNETNEVPNSPLETTLENFKNQYGEEKRSFSLVRERDGVLCSYCGDNIQDDLWISSDPEIQIKQLQKEFIHETVYSSLDYLIGIKKEELNREKESNKEKKMSEEEEDEFRETQIASLLTNLDLVNAVKFLTKKLPDYISLEQKIEDLRKDPVEKYVWKNIKDDDAGFSPIVFGTVTEALLEKTKIGSKDSSIKMVTTRVNDNLFSSDEVILSNEQIDLYLEKEKEAAVAWENLAKQSDSKPRKIRRLGEINLVNMCPKTEELK